ncbi:hypothetical protein HY085_03590 [Candidatus Gottesmanbacteria bacterium]|nr:hypothetical protein [Candidatus Gottesmanbacteria bacterium]
MARDSFDCARVFKSPWTNFLGAIDSKSPSSYYSFVVRYVFVGKEQKMILNGADIRQVFNTTSILLMLYVIAVLLMYIAFFREKSPKILKK